MGEPTSLDAAIRRLAAAAEAVEAAAAHGLEKARTARHRAEELAVLADDRTRLAEDLDASNARQATLAHVNREVARRLDEAIETIRVVLASQER